MMNRVFADPNIVLGLERIQEFLRDQSAARHFRVLVAMDMLRGGAVIGGSIFSYIPKSNCGFSEYIVVDASARGAGLGRMLVNARKADLDAAARAHGYAACRGLFIEADDPDRTPSAFLEAERHTALDALERLRLFDHLGFKRVDIRYVQPPLAPGKQAIDYLDLLFAPWEWSQPAEEIPAEWVFDTLEPVWSAWAPAEAATRLAALRRSISSPLLRVENVT